MAELSLRRFFRSVSKYGDLLGLTVFGDFRGYSRTIHIGFADNNPIVLANCHDLVQFNDFQLLIGELFDVNGIALFNTILFSAGFQNSVQGLRPLPLSIDSLLKGGAKRRTYSQLQAAWIMIP